MANLLIMQSGTKWDSNSETIIFDTDHLYILTVISNEIDQELFVVVAISELLYWLYWNTVGKILMGTI